MSPRSPARRENSSFFRRCELSNRLCLFGWRNYFLLDKTVIARARESYKRFLKNLHYVKGSRELCGVCCIFVESFWSFFSTSSRYFDTRSGLLDKKTDFRCVRFFTIAIERERGWWWWENFQFSYSKATAEHRALINFSSSHMLGSIARIEISQKNFFWKKSSSSS